MTFLLVVTFFTVVLTGPDGIAWRSSRRDRQRAIADQARAKVTYLPTGACRGNCPQHRDGEYPCLGIGPDD